MRNMLIVNAKVVTPLGNEAVKGFAMRRLDVKENSFIACVDGRIARIGSMAELPVYMKLSPVAFEQYDAEGCVVLPGFVDSHTHLVFGGYKVQLKAQIKIQTQTVKIRKLLPKRQIKATRIPLQKKIKAVKKKKPRKRIQHKKQQRKTKRLMRYQAKQPSNQQLKSLNRVKYFFSLSCLIKAILNQSFM